MGSPPAVTPEDLLALGLDPDSNPDLMVGGNLFDVLTPSASATAASIRDAIADKVRERKTHRVAVNLSGTTTETSLRAVLSAKPIADLEEVLTLTETGIGRAFP